jgi:PAS domain S-box-containing protein
LRFELNGGIVAAMSVVERSAQPALGPRLTRGGATARYAAAICAVVVIAAARYALIPVLGLQAPLLPFVLAIYVAGYLGGVGPGILATVLSGILGTALFTSPLGGDHPLQWSAHVTALLIVGVIITLVLDRLRQIAAAQHAALIEARIAQTAASESRAQLRLIADSLPVLIAYVDTDLRYRFVNACYESWFGERARGLIGRSVSELLGPEAYREVEQHLQRALSGEAMHYETRMVYAATSVREVSAHLMPDIAEDGAVRGVVTLVEDVTARKQAERELLESERRLQLIYDSSSDGLWLVRVESGQVLRLVSVNETYLRIGGHRREDVIGRTVDETVTPEQRAAVREKYLQAIDMGQPVAFHETVSSATGLRHAEVRLNPIIDADGKVGHVLGAMTDVTLRTQAEEALRAADQHKDQFLAMLAHELRNPLAPISNVANLLAAKPVESHEAKRLGEVLGRQTAQLAHLLDDLLDAARITRGLIELKKTPVALVSVVDEAAETLQPLIALKRQTILREPPSGAVWVCADRVRLRQVFENLLSNAVKYSPDRTSIRIFYSGDGTSISVHVKDEGSGIDARLLPKVFDLFMQEDASLDRAQGGLGMGLTIVRHLVALHGGTVEARSDGVSRGSEFIVRLPLETLAPPLEAKSPHPTRGMAHRILVVEDNVDSAESLALVLRDAGHQVQVAYDGPAALALMPQFNPQVVLLDIGLPKMNGYLVAQEMRKWMAGKPLHLYALSGYGTRDDKERARSAGFDAHFTKPVDPESLLRRLAQPA